jgi:hypothetical protein
LQERFSPIMRIEPLEAVLFAAREDEVDERVDIDSLL